MNLLSKSRNWLLDPRLKGIDYSSDDLLRTHLQILSEKKLMRDVFSDFYATCMGLDARFLTGEGMRIEIGAGVSFFKRQYPGIISTDIKKADHLDRVLDAQNMDLPAGSVRALYGLNCFHHFPEPVRFFAELERVLVKGGGCILIEPYFGPIATRFFKNLHSVETFDKSQVAWSNSNTERTNQALSFIVFERDRRMFDQLFPNLELVYRNRLNNYLRYLLSGGLNFRPLLPYCARPLIRACELFLTPFNRFFALHHVIVIRKR